MQKIKLNILEHKKHYVLLAIDYHTRYLYGEVIRNKSAARIDNGDCQKWTKNHMPVELIIDNGK